MDEEKIYSTPSKVTAKRGAVKAVGPDSVEVKFTPEAALETADRLTQAAVAAKGETMWRN